MVSDSTRRLVWEGLILSGARARYYGILCGRHGKVDRWVAIVASVLSASAFFAFISKFGAWVPGAAALVASILAAYVAASQHSRKAFLSCSLYAKYSEQEAAYEDLWVRIEANEALDVARELQTLRTRELAFTERAPHELGNDRALMEECQRHVEHFRTEAPAGAASQA